MRHFSTAEVVIIALMIALVFCVKVPIFSTVTRVPADGRQLINLKQVGIVLKEYAIDHDNHLPAHISDLPPGMLPLPSSQYHDPDRRVHCPTPI